MASTYAEAHKFDNLAGPGDGRPTALQIINDNDLIGKLSDKVFIVTGASSGIGIETGRALAATGARVFLTARNLEKCQTACSSFLEPGRVELLLMDNNSLASVRAAAAEFLKRSDRLNVLVNNAGIMAAPDAKTEDGFESHLGTNHLAHFLFFNLLKDTLIKSSTPEFNSRVVNVGSMGHLWGQINFGNYNMDGDGVYDPFAAYSQSKTANNYMANYIETKYGEKGLHGLSLNPGWILTGIQRHLPWEKMLEWKETLPHIEKTMKSVEQGAATTILAAVGKDFEGKGRLYLEDCAVTELTTDNMSGHAAWAFDEEKEERLWQDSLKMVGL